MVQPHGEDILNWGEFDLHLLVACFLRVRFPIVVALNKADTSEATEHIARVQAGDEGFNMLQPVEVRKMEHPPAPECTWEADDVVCCWCWHLKLS